MKSMTGFGRSSNRAQITAPSGQVSQAVSADMASTPVELDISIRTVNGRYLELRFHVPREYASLESEFKALLNRKFSRGTVDVYIHRRSVDSASGSGVVANSELAKKWLSAYRKLGQDLAIQQEPTLEMISRIPDVLRLEENSELSDQEKILAKDFLAVAADSCNLERTREGRALQTELESLCARLGALAVRIEEMKTEAKAELENRYLSRMREALQKLGFEGKIDEQRMAQEIVIQMDRGDISEELHRLKEHLSAYRNLLKSDEPQGKKLDFYAQELLREVNTVGSKSHIATLTSLVVECKTLVEKIRELVQNVE